MHQRLGPYRILRRLSTGGMGEVFLAVLERPGGFTKTVALKTILPTLCSTEAFLRLFEEEAKAAASLNHANIVQVFDHGCETGRTFLTMEYVEGIDLARLRELHPEPLPPALVAEIGIQCCRALAHAHQRKDLRGAPMHLIHGDISPSNLLVSAEGLVKLTDFGLARIQRAIKAGGPIAGKPAYMSPEQARGENLGPGSDLFSLGLVLWELLTGRAPPLPPGDTATQLAHVASGRNLDLSGLPPGFQEMLSMVLARESSARHADAEALAAACSKACSPSGPDGLAALARAVQAKEPHNGPLAPEPTLAAQQPVATAPGTAKQVRQKWAFGLAALLAIVTTVAAWSWSGPGLPKTGPDQFAALLPTTPLPPQEPVPATAPTTQGEPGPLPAGPAPDAPEPEPVAKPGPTGVRPHPKANIPARVATASGPDLPKDATSPAPQATAPVPILSVQVLGDSRAFFDQEDSARAKAQWTKRAPHLVRLTTGEAEGFEALLRMVPNPRGPGWRLNINAMPWMAIRLNGKDLGQTPRGGLLVVPGKSKLLLHQGKARLEMELEVAEPADASK